MKKIILLTGVFCWVLKITSAQSIVPDHSFGSDGIVKTDFGKHYNYFYGTTGIKVLVGSGGAIFDIIQANSESFISKRHANGSIDTSYGINGFSDIANVDAHDALIQPDGKIIVAGSIVNLKSYNDFALARYNQDGSLDKSFSGDGVQITSFGDVFSFIISVALQNNGKIVVAGYTNANFAVSRYNPDGSPDKTFSDDGTQITDFNTGNNHAQAVAIQKNGKIVVSGYTWNGSDYDFALARYNTDGSPDSTFGSDGKKTTSFGGNDYAYATAIGNDNKIIVAGYVSLNNNNFLALARYNTDGTPDSTFADKGKEIIDYGANFSTIPAIVLQKDKIIIAFYVWNGSNYDFAVAKFNSTGLPDKTFSDDGKQTTDFNNGNDYARGITIQKDGKILLTGGVDSAGSFADFALSRYNSDGSPDSSFGNNGKLKDKFRQGYTIYKKTAVQKDGKIVAAGFTWNGKNFDFALARYTTDGSPDPGFSGDGKQTTSFGNADDYGYSLAIQNDGKIVVAGAASNGKNFDFAVARYNTNGEPDKTFAVDGKRIISFGAGDDYANAVVIQNDGKILAAGLGNQSTALLRLTPGGNPDSTFSNDGKKISTYAIGSSVANAVALQKDGKIVVTGRAEYNFTLARYNIDGNLDNGFADNGKLVTNYGEIYGENSSYAIAIQNDGKIIIAGEAHGEEESLNIGLARYTPEGKPDSTFGQDGIVTGGFGTAYSLAFESDGKILVSGRSGYQSHSSITRINNNGTFDSTFGNNGTHISQISGQDDFFNDITIADNKLYAAGTCQCPGNLGTVAKYVLIAHNNTPPLITLTNPSNNRVYTAPATIYLRARATDEDGIIEKVQFYNGATLLHTEYVSPYGFAWYDVPAGNYTLTAIATDNDGLVTTSKSIHMMVIGNKATLVQLTLPNNATYANIPLTGADLFNGLLSLKLSPNPVHNTLRVTINGKQNKATELCILSASGVPVKNIRSVISNEVPLDISSLANGVYFIKVVSGDKVIYKQFIKL